MRLMTIAAVIASLTGCGGNGDNSPTAPTPPANIAGTYDATITAASTCSANLPTEARTLQFLSEVTQTGATVQVKLIAKVPGVPELTFSATVSGQTVNFPSFSFTQAMGRGAGLSASGNATVGSGANPSITGTLSGTYQTASGASCNATNHQLQMVKLCPTPTTTGTAMLPCQ